MIEIGLILTGALWVSYFFKTVIAASDLYTKKVEERERENDY